MKAKKLKKSRDYVEPVTAITSEQNIISSIFTAVSNAVKYAARNPMSCLTWFLYMQSAVVQAVPFRTESKTRNLEIVKDSVSYPKSKSGDFYYQAETGCVISDWKFIEHNNYGRSGYHVSEKVAANSDAIYENKMREIFNELEKKAQENNKEKLLEEIHEQKEYFLEAYKRTRSSHSSLKVHWNIKHKGNEFNRKGGGLHLGIESREECFPDPEIIKNRFMRRINNRDEL